MASVDLITNHIFIFFLSNLGPNTLSAAVPRGHVTVSCVRPLPRACLAQHWPVMAFLMPPIHSLIYSYLAKSSLILSEIRCIAAPWIQRFLTLLKSYWGRHDQVPETAEQDEAESLEKV